MNDLLRLLPVRTLRRQALRSVLTVIGGFNANQLLRAIDWELLAAHPKVFCGYSDITALQNAMLAKANVE